MLNWLKAVWSFVRGKKTYILSFVLVVTILVLLFLGYITPELAMVILPMALFAATFRSALAAHSAQTLQLLSSFAALGVAARQHNKAAEAAAATATAEQGAALGAEIAEENKS